MKATGIVRRIDDLGRIVIPKEIRRTLRIREGDPLEIYTEKDGEVIFKKYPPYPAYPRGRPVADIIDTVGKILLRHAGSVKKMGTGLYIVTEVEGATVGIREGWNGRK